MGALRDGGVGFCLGTTIKKKKSAWKYGYLIWLAVAPSHQGQGVGQALYQHFQALAAANGARLLFIDTQADSPAVHFWRRQGFGHAQAHVFLSTAIGSGVAADPDVPVTRFVPFAQAPDHDGSRAGSRDVSPSPEGVRRSSARAGGRGLAAPTLAAPPSTGRATRRARRDLPP
jgi:hypothetical protein